MPTQSCGHGTRPMVRYLPINRSFLLTAGFLLSFGLACYQHDRYRPGAPGEDGSPGDPAKGDKHVKRITPWLGGAALVAAIAWATRASAAPPVPLPEAAQVIEVFEVPRGGDLLVLPVTIAGQLHWFALYTGATNSVFDQSLRK